MARRPIDAQEMSMIPMMNLVTILIPFLLAAATFVQVGVVEVTVPADGPSTGADSARPLVAIARDGLTVSVDGQELAVLTCGGLCATAEDVPSAAVGEALRLLALPPSTTLVLVPSDDVPYDVVIGVMDAARSHGGPALFPEVAIGGR